MPPHPHLRLVPPPPPETEPARAPLAVQAAAALLAFAEVGLGESLLLQALTTRVAVAMGRAVDDALHAVGHV